MLTQTLTLNVPRPLYEQLKHRAERAHRSVEEEMLEVLVTAIPADDPLPAQFAEAIESLTALDDTALWEAAGSRLADDVSERLATLHLKQQREGLTEVESRTLARFVQQYETLMLVRAQAASLLRERGHDVTELFKS